MELSRNQRLSIQWDKHKRSRIDQYYMFHRFDRELTYKASLRSQFQNNQLDKYKRNQIRQLHKFLRFDKELMSME